MSYELHTEVSHLPYIGSKTAEKLKKKGIKTLEDLLYFLPRRHLDRSNIVKIAEASPGKNVTCLGTVRNVESRKSGRLRITEALLFDGTGYLFLVWFGERKIEKTLKPGTSLSVSGTVNYFKGRLQIENPEYEIVEDGNTLNLLNTGKIVPVYPKIDGLSQKLLRKIIYNALQSTYIPEILPPEIVVSEGLLPRHTALIEVHFPKNSELLSRAIYRFRFEEIYILQTALAYLKSAYQNPEAGIVHEGDMRTVESFLSSLKVELTPSQKRAIDEIIRDMTKSKPMNRLLQGEVGSGKTIVALAAAVYASSSGYQTAFMAPTEILAIQQFEKYRKNLESCGITCSLLTSSIKGKERSQILEDVKEGRCLIVFGTHTLIYEDVVFKNLGLVIIDEQHRFGTMQRLLLREKGKNPDLLIISATPIPRTLALTVFGDLDISTLKERPSGYDLKRQVETHHLSSEKREVAYLHLKEEVQKGNQAFIVVPLIEESPKLEARTIKEVAAFTEKYVDKKWIGVLHGKQSPPEKQKIIESFRNGELKVLITTTVVEVGVDVPSATIMIIENAERFGLSQLHQLRGRVGRGKEKSYVYAVSDLPTEESARRLEVFSKIYDGFRLAEEDLKLRGEGEIFGYRQSGPSNLKFVQVSENLDLLDKIRKLSFDYYQRFNMKSVSVKIILEEASRKYPNLEIAYKA